MTTPCKVFTGPNELHMPHLGFQLGSIGCAPCMQRVCTPTILQPLCTPLNKQISHGILGHVFTVPLAGESKLINPCQHAFNGGSINHAGISSIVNARCPATEYQSVDKRLSYTDMFTWSTIDTASTACYTYQCSGDIRYSTERQLCHQRRQQTKRNEEADPVPEASCRRLTNRQANTTSSKRTLTT